MAAARLAAMGEPLAWRGLMTIVLVEIYGAPAAAGVVREVRAFRQAHPDVGVCRLHTHRSRTDRELAATFRVRSRPAFLFTDEEGEELARARGRTARALEAALAAVAGHGDGAADARRARGGARRQLGAQKLGFVRQVRRAIVIDGLNPRFEPSAGALRALGCQGWVRDGASCVTATFATVHDAERAFSRMMSSDALGLSKALPDEVGWMSERMNR